MKSHGCTLNCFGCCKFNVYTKDNEIIKIEADKNHPYTKGIMCEKGRKHLERLKDKDRLLYPMKKVDNKWVKISFEEAIDMVSSKLSYYREKYSSNSVFHYSESGSGSILKGIEDIFFYFYGGISKASGGTCWSAGIKAQKYDFGANKSSTIDDLLNSKNIILWSKNPSNTHIHLLDIVKKAKQNGAKIIIIDPIYNNTTKIADIHIRPRPSSDGALAMAMTKIIIENNLHDVEFIKNNVIGYEEYKNYLDTLDLNYLCDECQVDKDIIERLAFLYAGEKYTSICIGYGIQRYINGGNTIRAIDALSSITGNIGKSGSGVNYSNNVLGRILDVDVYNSHTYAKNEKYFDLYDFARYAKENLKAIFISKSNPLNQWPNLNEFINAFKNIEFKVCIDMFMTDTAKHCDLVIPCTNTLESEDLLYSSMSNPYLIYNEKCIEPNNMLMDEYYFFMEVAKKMNIENYPYVSKKEYLNEIVKKYDITLEQIKSGYVTSNFNDVAWSDLIFETPSKKIEIYSQNAKLDGVSPIPIYISEKSNKLRLITTHSKESLLSQHFKDIDDLAIANINEEIAKEYDIKNGDIVSLKSDIGKIRVRVNITNDIKVGVIQMIIGWWEKSSNPNFLTPNKISDMGKQITYNSTFVEIQKKC